MPNRRTRSNKEKELVTLSIDELARLERTNRKAKKQSAMVAPLILVEDAEGHLVDREGNRRNEEGQRIDQEGNVIVEQQVQQVAENVGVPAAVNNAAGRFVQRTLGDYN